MSASDIEVVDWIKFHGPVTESEFTEENPGKGEKAAKSALVRAHKKHLLQRIVTIQKKGRPVWLYYADEEQVSIEKTRQIFVPLRRLDEFKIGIVTKEIKQLLKEGICLATMTTIARRAGFPPSQIESEVFALAEELGLILVDREVPEMNSGLTLHINS
ncbi:MAG TPA: hypothetical protein VN739_00300 [Nitrososphaerales archaeon]|nr:hypothetical protein [Nitrososphaerales archaeon]